MRTATAKSLKPSRAELETENEILRNALDELKAENDEIRANYRELLRNLKKEQKGRQSESREHQALLDKYSALLSERNELRKELAAIDETTVDKADYEALSKEYSRMEQMYITARTLVNIPESMEELVFELLKSRFLILDKIAYLGGGLLDAKKNPVADAGKFEWYTELLPPVKENRQETAESENSI